MSSNENNEVNLYDILRGSKLSTGYKKAIDDVDLKYIEDKLKNGDYFYIEMISYIYYKISIDDNNLREYLKIIELLLKYGLKPDRRINFEWPDTPENVGNTTPLNYSLLLGCYIDNYYLVELLLKFGADPNLSTDLGDFNSTPLCYAINECNSSKLVELLLDYGANSNQVCDKYFGNNELSRSLEKAIEKENFNIVKLLLEYGANANEPSVEFIDEDSRRCNHYYLPINKAISKRNLIIAKLLLEHRADVNKPCYIEYKRQWTSLHISIMMKNYQMFTLLYTYGAICDLINCFGETLLQMAERYSVDAIHKFLTERKSRIVEAINHHHFDDICWLLKNGKLDFNPYELIGIVKQTVPQQIPKNQDNIMYNVISFSNKLIKPWRPNVSSHFLFHSGFRENVKQLLLINQRLNSKQTILPKLPREIIEHVLGFCNRDFWNPLPLK